MNIISSDIVSTEYDSFWEDVSSFVKNMGPRPVLVIVPGMETGSADQLQLQKMLQACKLQPDQHNVVEIGNDDKVAWHKLNHSLAPAVVFLVGILPSQLGISALFRFCEPNRFDNVIWLPAPSVSVLEQNPEIKKQLWASGMKPVFVDKAYGDFTAVNNDL